MNRVTGVYIDIERFQIRIRIKNKSGKYKQNKIPII